MTPFRKDLKDALKAVATARWDKEAKAWTFAATPAVTAQLRDLFEAFKLSVKGRADLLEVDRGQPPAALERWKGPAPWEHQIAAAHKIGQSFGCYIHGGMGVGKTRSVVDAVVNYDLKAVLVLCPASVVRVWPKEFGKYAAVDVEVLALDQRAGTIEKRTKLARTKLEAAQAAPSKPIVVIVINYEAAWREPFASFVEGREWDLIVLDEAHRIKSAKGKQSKWCEGLRTHAKRIAGLSGTPMPHSPLDVFGQFRAIDPGVYGDSLTRFRARYEASYFVVNEDARPTKTRLEIALANDETFRSTWEMTRDDLEAGNDFRYDLSLAVQGARFGWDNQEIVNLLIAHRKLKRKKAEALGYNYYIPILNKVRERSGGPSISRWRNLDELRRKMDTVTLRIDRSVLNLTEATDTTRYLDLDAEERRVHGELSEDLVTEMKAGRVTAANALTRLLRLQQVTGGFVKTDEGDLVEVGETRRKALQDIFDELRRDVDEEGRESFEPVVVFCRFHRDLDNVGFASQEVTGQRALELSGRANELAEWQTEGAPPVLAVQIQSGGLGVDLTRACYAIYYSLGFSLGDYEQAKARIHRPGQKRPVTHVHMVATGSVDEHVYEALAGKKNVVEYVLDRIKP